MKQIYKGVNRDELKQATGYCPSITYEKYQGFVIGPDVQGRLVHVASCLTLHKAKEYAKRMNETVK